MGQHQIRLTIDYQDIVYYSAPKSKKRRRPKSLDEVDPEILRAYEKLGKSHCLSRSG